MAKNETKTANKTTDTATATNAPVKKDDNKLYITREPYTSKSDGKDYFAYLMRVKIRGKDTKIDFAPPDNGGYEPLDLVFGELDTAELHMHEEETSDKDGKKKKYMVYEAVNYDEDGIPYIANIKPARKSDSNLLDMHLTQRAKVLAIKKAAELAAKEIAAVQTEPTADGNPDNVA